MKNVIINAEHQMYQANSDPGWWGGVYLFHWSSYEHKMTLTPKLDVFAVVVVAV
eukprot:m.123545 g.123545  ORF g.123545 m.123545 type:complete len:54 (+) comp28995_c0_seq7:607-768(+)